MNNKIIISAAIALVIGAGAGFFGGMYYQKSKAPTFTRQFGANGAAGGTRGGGGARGGAAGGFRPATGQIISKDDKSITVKLMDGSSKIVLLSPSTVINKADAATATDLTIGQTVAVFGQTNSDGSVTAQNVQLNPMMFRGGQNPTPTP